MLKSIPMLQCPINLVLNVSFIAFPNPTNPTEDTTFYHREEGMTTVEVDGSALSTGSLANNT